MVTRSVIRKKETTVVVVCSLGEGQRSGARSEETGLEMGNMGSAGCGCTGLSSTLQIMIASTPRRQRFSDFPASGLY